MLAFWYIIPWRMKLWLWESIMWLCWLIVILMPLAGNCVVNFRDQFCFPMDYEPRDQFCFLLITNLAINFVPHWLRTSRSILFPLGCEPRNQFCDSFAFSSGNSGLQLRWPTHSKFPRDGREASFHNYDVHLGGVFITNAFECFCDGRFHRLISNFCF